MNNGFSDMKVFTKILLNVCIIVLAFFLGRISNVCVTSDDCKNINSNFERDAINSNTEADDKDSSSNINYDSINDEIDSFDTKPTENVGNHVDIDGYTNDNLLNDSLSEDEQDIEHEEPEYNIE